jgi:alpha-galactosidase
MKEIYSEYALCGMRALYIRDEDNRVGLTLVPEELYPTIDLDGRWAVSPCVQLHLAGDPFPDGFAHGHTMLGSGSTKNLVFQNQTVEEDAAGSMTVQTTYADPRVQARHYLSFGREDAFVRSWTELENQSAEPWCVEMLTSFALCGFPMAGPNNRVEDLVLHRLRSKWSAEGRLTGEAFADLQLEPSWAGYGVQSIRFGEVGSMPVRGFFPWCVLEDRKYQSLLGVQLSSPSSWQIEVYSRGSRYDLCGGQADFEFGHWRKTLAPGEIFRSVPAVLTAGRCDVDAVAANLVAAQRPVLAAVPANERSLPIIFNEYCTTWGRPSEENLLKIAEKLKGQGIDYLVIDAGWYSNKPGDWTSGIGDWNVNRELFPNGLRAVCDRIRACGMIPGLWFEMETIGDDAAAPQPDDAWHRTDLQLKRDGRVLSNGARRFWDMRKPEVIEYLSEKVIGTLRECGLGYLKVDYNDNIGIGCDGAESYGEGLRQTVLGSLDFFARIRRELPDLVIENCSSGGHRLEPSLMARVSMASFSDAHECQEIPIIAANVHRAILPAQSQIWAVLHGKDSARRLYYSLNNTMLGRMCLSGDIYNLSDEQWGIVRDSIAFYRKAAPVIRDGRSRRAGPPVVSYRHPEGWQALIRHGDNGQILVVVSTFAHMAGRDLTMGGFAGCEMIARFVRPGVQVRLERGSLHISGAEDFEGLSVLLGRRQTHADAALGRPQYAFSGSGR